VVAARRAVDDAQHGTDRKLGPEVKQGLEFVPSPCVHADLAAAPALAAPDQERAAALIEIALGQSERLLDPQPGSPQDHDQGAWRRPWARSPAARMTAMISSTLGGSAGYRSQCFAADARRGSRAWSQASDVGRRGRAATPT
jgi:hypothetical protein